MHFHRQTHDSLFLSPIRKTTCGINAGKYFELREKCLFVIPLALVPSSVTWLVIIYVRKFFCLDFVKMERSINVRLKKGMNNVCWVFVPYQLKSVKSPNAICLSSKTSVNYYIWCKVCTCTTCMVTANRILSGFIPDNKYCHYRHSFQCCQ